MPHFRVDDALHSHPKAQRAGDEALGMWTRAGSFCMAYLTDGFVPEWWVKQQPKGAAKAKRLVEAGLWNAGAVRDGEKGWQFHEFTGPGRQDSRSQIEAEREKWRKKKAYQRTEASSMSPRDTPEVSPRDTPDVSPRDTRGESPGVSLRVTRDPTQPNVKASSGYVDHAPLRNAPGEREEERGQERGRSDPVHHSASRLVSTLVPQNTPAAVKTSLRLAASQLMVGDGLPSEVVAEALRRWTARPDAGPGLLPHLASTVLREGTALKPSSKLRDWAEFADSIPEDQQHQQPSRKAIEQ